MQQAKEMTPQPNSVETTEPAPHQTPILVLNLERATERMAAISKRLIDMGLRYERVNAVDGASLSETELRRVSPLRPWRYQPTPSEIGCYLSHLKALGVVVARAWPKAIVLEDDAVFDEAFLAVARGRDMPEEVELLKLEGCPHPRGLGFTKLFAKHPAGDIVFKSEPGANAAAYFVTLEGARKALINLKAMRTQIDTDLFEYWKTGISSFHLAPYPVRQDSVPSNIDHDSLHAPMCGEVMMRLTRPFLKRWDRHKKRKSARQFLERLNLPRDDEPSLADSASQDYSKRESPVSTQGG